MKDATALVKELLDEHSDLYRSYSKLILSLSTGAIGLLTAFRKNWLTGDEDQWLFLALISMGLLLLAFISGLVLQHQIMLRPLSLVKDVG